MNFCCFKPSPSAGPGLHPNPLSPHPVPPSAPPALIPMPRPPILTPVSVSGTGLITSCPEGCNSSSCKYRQVTLPKAADLITAPPPGRAMSLQQPLLSQTSSPVSAHVGPSTRPPAWTLPTVQTFQVASHGSACSSRPGNVQNPLFYEL